MILFNWTSKKETININAHTATQPDTWALPFLVHCWWGKYNVALSIKNSGECEFKKEQSTGWFIHSYIMFLCFYIEIQFDRWYDGKS